MSDDDVNVSLPRDRQAVALFLGDGQVCIAPDDSQPDLWNLGPILTAVTVARLRALADLIEASPTPTRRRPLGREDVTR